MSVLRRSYGHVPARRRQPKKLRLPSLPLNYIFLLSLSSTRQAWLNVRQYPAWSSGASAICFASVGGDWLAASLEARNPLAGPNFIAEAGKHAVDPWSTMAHSHAVLRNWQRRFMGFYVLPSSVASSPVQAVKWVEPCRGESGHLDRRRHTT